MIKYKQEIAVYSIHVILYGNIILAKYAKYRINIKEKVRGSTYTSAHG